MALQKFILDQIRQLKELTEKFIKCWHHSHERKEKLKLTEELLKEVESKHELLINSIRQPLIIKQLKTS